MDLEDEPPSLRSLSFSSHFFHLHFFLPPFLPSLLWTSRGHSILGAHQTPGLRWVFPMHTQ